MTSGSLEFTVSRTANPATDAERESILADPGFGKYSHRPHGVDRLHRRTGLARCAGHRVRPDRAGSVGDRAALRAGSLRRAQGLPLGGRVDRVVSRRGQRRAVAVVGAAARDSRTARRAVHRIAAPADRRRQRVGAAGRRRGVAVSAAVHVRDRAGVGRATGQAVPLPGDRLAGGRVLQGRHQSGHRLGVNGVRARQPGRYRRGQVRRQLRRLAAGAGRSRRERLRPGGMAGRRRAPLRRGDGRDEPLLRVRQRRIGAPGHPGAVRLAAAGYHPGFVAAVGNRRRILPSRNARSTSTSGRRRPPPARSPRCSPAAPPRSSPRSRR